MGAEVPTVDLVEITKDIDTIETIELVGKMDIEPVEEFTTMEIEIYTELDMKMVAKLQGIDLYEMSYYIERISVIKRVGIMENFVVVDLNQELLSNTKILFDIFN